jgi:dTDP-4-amino-4,6-dideoxygalactose transaminase
VGVDLPTTDRLSRELLTLPLNHALTEGDVDAVLESIRAFLE